MDEVKKTDRKNYLLAYYQEIKEGKVAVGKWIEKIYERIMQGLADKEFLFDAKKADHAIDWIETHCFHTAGKLAPGPFKLELWQKAMLSAMFGLIDEDGNRHFREIVLIIARKNGKSLLASAIARYIWCTGSFGTRVYNIAPKLDQAKIIYDSIWTMTQLDPEWQRKKKLSQERDAHKRKLNEDDPTMERHRMSDLFIPANDSTVTKLAFAAQRLDGFNPALTVLDEFASYPAQKGLSVYEVVKSAVGAQAEPMTLSISTAGYISDGIYDELMKRSTAYLLGTSKEKRLLPFLYMIDDVEKWNDINELRKSNPNLGVSVTVDYLLEEIAIAEGSLSKKAEFLTKYCNIKQNLSTAWLDAVTVEKTTGAPLRLEDFENCYAVMGIDLSKTTDLSAATLVIERDGILNVFARFYLPKEKIEEATIRDGLPYQAYIQRGLLYPSGDNFIDYKDIYAWACELVEKYKIYPLKVGYDRYSATYLVQDMAAYGFQMDDVYQGTNLTPIIRTCEGLMKDGKINIGDNDLLKVHFLNSAIKVESETERLRLIKIEQKAHIDGMAALLCALCVRQKWWSEIGAQLVNERRH